MPDVVLDYHRYKTPIDHPDLSVTRPKLEALLSENLLYHAIRGDANVLWKDGGYYSTIAFPDAYADKAIRSIQMVGYSGSPPVFSGVLALRMGSYAYDQCYEQAFDAYPTTADHWIGKWSAGTLTRLAIEAVDLGQYREYQSKFSASGSTLKAFRTDMTTPKITATDTAFASGYIGMYGEGIQGNVPSNSHAYCFLEVPASVIPPTTAILEVEVAGKGTRENPYRPLLSEKPVEILGLSGLPDFLYRDAKRYDVLRSKGFTDDEIKALLGYIPQHQINLDSVTWGAFELHADKAPIAIVVITGDNPYKSGAIERQKAVAKRIFTPPRSYDEAVALYNTLKKDYPHWLAGKDNMAYQTLGLEIFDWMQNIDFYYGELIEHKTHYQQLKQVPDWEMRNRLNELRERLSKVSVLVDERDKHLKKIDEILKRGW
jgi:hypothetical protein